MPQGGIKNIEERVYVTGCWRFEESQDQGRDLGLVEDPFSGASRKISRRQYENESFSIDKPRDGVHPAETDGDPSNSVMYTAEAAFFHQRGYSSGDSHRIVKNPAAW